MSHLTLPFADQLLVVIIAFAFRARLIERGIQTQEVVSYGIVRVNATEVVLAVRIAEEVLTLDTENVKYASLNHMRTGDMAEIVGESSFSITGRHRQ